MLSNALRTSINASRASLGLALPVRGVNTIKSFKAHGRALEDMAARENDQLLLKKLKEKLRAEKTEEGNSHADLVEKLEENAAAAEEWAPGDFSHHEGDYITMDEFLLFRKDLIKKVRDLEDELAELKLRF